MRLYASMLRQATDRPPAQRRDKSGPGRRGADKADKASAPVLCGWNLPTVPDSDNIIVWMKREKNGDNVRKKVNEVYEEEQYRHVQGHCGAIDNTLLFQRQSLHDRYLKNCQFGIKDARAAKVVASTPVQPTTVSARIPRPPSRPDSERNCFSAGAVADESEAIEAIDEGLEEGAGREEVRVALSRGRSHSASLRAYGMTLPDTSTTHHGVTAEDESEDTAWDEGYGSKVSSNDPDHDAPDDGGLRHGCRPGHPPPDDGTPGGTSRAGGAVAVARVNPVLPAGPGGEPLSHQDAMAKLMYSRRERTVYERTPSRRVRGINSFRYAGREQSRLTEASLSHITPAYLARYHHLADLATTAAARHRDMDRGDQEDRGDSRSDSPSSASSQPQQQDTTSADKGGGSQAASSGASGGSGGNGCPLQPRTMVLRKITIQDSAKNLFQQNLQATSSGSGGDGGDGAAVVSPNKAAPAVLPQASDQVRRRHGLLSPPRAGSERSISETRLSEVAETSRPAVTGVARSGFTEGSGCGGQQQAVCVTVQELTPGLGSPLGPATPGTLPTPASSSSTTITPLRGRGAGGLGVPGAEEGSPPVLSPHSLPSPCATDRLTMSTFAVTDLLPAVERNLRTQRTTQRGLSKSRTMDVSNVGYVNSRRQQQQQRPQYQKRTQLPEETSTTTNGFQEIAPANREITAVLNGSLNKQATSGDVRSFPAFRPHHHMSPLQRAKEIANRRTHGHVTQMPDGSETVRVTSPRYASRTEQRQNHTRARSASRFPPLLRQPTQQAGSTCNVPKSLSKAHSSLTLNTTLSKSHSSLFTHEDMAARLGQQL